MAKKKQKRTSAPKMIDHESTVGGCISDAISELEMLGQEMRDAFDNTPESLQNDGVGAARGEAADALENISEPSVPESLDQIVVKWQTRALSPSAMRRQSRSDRRYDAIATLEAARDKLEEIIDENNKKEWTDEQREDAKQLLSEIEDMISEAEGVDFPGMYG